MAVDVRRLARAVYGYVATKTDELSFDEGATVTIKKSIEGGWWEGEFNGNVGWFPSNYVEEMPAEPAKPQPPAPPPKPTRGASFNAGLVLSTAQLPPAQQHSQAQPSGKPIPPWKPRVSLAGAGGGGGPSMPPVTRNKHQSIMAYQTLVGQEIVDTERKYVKELDDFHDQFVAPLRDSSLLSVESKAHIFGNFDELFRFQRKFLKDLTSAIECDPDSRRIGGFFLASRPLFRQIYGRFSSKHPKAVEILNKYHDNADLCALMERLGSKTKPPTLVLTQAWMKPSQRVKKYVALLKEAVRYTDDDHSDKADVSQALSVYVEIDMYLCEMRRRKEDELMIANSRIEGLDGGELEALGELSLMSYFMVPSKENGPLEERALLLYPQFVIGLAKVTGKGKYDFKLREKLCMKDVTVSAIDDVGNLSNAFEIATPKKTMRVSTHTGSDREQWVSALQSHARKAQNPTPMLEPLTSELREEIVEADSRPKKKKFAIGNLFHKDKEREKDADHNASQLQSSQSASSHYLASSGSVGSRSKSTDLGVPSSASAAPAAPKRSLRSNTMEPKSVLDSSVSPSHQPLGRANTLPLKSTVSQPQAPVFESTTTDAYDVISQYGNMENGSSSSAADSEPLYANLPAPQEAHKRKASLPTSTATMTAATGSTAPIFRGRTNAASIHLNDEEASAAVRDAEQSTLSPLSASSAPASGLTRKPVLKEREPRRSPSFGDVLGVVETLQKQVELLTQEVANLKINLEQERSARESLERIVQHQLGPVPAPRVGLSSRDR